jgi:hypothetical protein
MHPGVATSMRPVSRIIQDYTTFAQLHHVFRPETQRNERETTSEKPGEVMLSPRSAWRHLIEIYRQ